MEDESGYNPLAKTNLGKSVVDALLASEEIPFSRLKKFAGAGIYAIYYCGKFAPYRMFAELDSKGAKIPIYVGKAVPKGGRKGSGANHDVGSSALSKRLFEHRASLEAVESLQVSDFSFRKLVVDDIWISLGETLIIDRFRPLWNTVVEGFGNHNPGAGRFMGRRPLWDELHPGRAWAEQCRPAKYSEGEIIEMVKAYFSKDNALE